MAAYFNQSAESVLKALDTQMEGLQDSQVTERRQKYGDNTLTETKRKSPIVVFLEQFKDLLVGILIVAAIISMFSGEIESTIVIFAVIILNAILGTVQHFKAEKSLASLKSLSSPTAKVLRNGVKIEIPSAEVVPGDIVFLEAGDMVVADGRILENYSLQVNESSLTGESENVTKIAEKINQDKLPLGDQKNMVFSGSFITYGRAVMVVTSTGMNTEIGKIATLMNQTQQKATPLQVSLDEFSKKLALVIIAICIVVFGLGLYRNMPFLDALMFAVALAVAAIPEALSSIVTIVLAMGTQKMVKENAIIKQLKAVESLGSVSIICSDKTGTLTQNKMTVQQIYTDHQLFDCKKLDRSNPVHQLLLDTAVLANDATIIDGNPIGDPTEFALIDLAHHFEVEEVSYREQYPRLSEIPFDSDRKLMSTVHMLNGKRMMLTKGALDVLMERVTQIYTAKGVCPITPEDKQKILDANQHLSENGLRVLAFACKELNTENNITLEDEQGYTFVGLISMIDPPREESKQAVADARRAGIKPIMITGDHKVTASAIAKQIGIMQEGDMALTGLELDAFTDQQLDEVLEKVSVYARVSPEHKIRIVDAWQRKGKIVSMTGDGVNDAPALKKADIGIAMGITGTEVSKDAASMILTDDNFATIVKAVANGRNVYRNIKNAIKFLLGGNMAGILVVLYTSIAALPVPFVPVHLLFINLLTDSLPAIAIGMEPASKDVLKDPPRDPKEGILTGDFLMRICVEGCIIGIFTLIAFYIGLQTSAAVASTMAFCTLSLARLFHGFNCRSKHSIGKVGLFSNIYSVLAFVVGVLLLSAVMYIPFLHGLFSVAPLSGANIGFIYLLAFCPTFIIQLYKSIREAVFNRKNR
ncbi:MULTISPECIES: cation-translocating P-type ATPase [Clostridiaceae]|uniref:Cation-translocating P-type ATPase n=1 Tax=Clostridium facile TaxID=2763035 RepID=A0ABR7IUK6_9CLOT|nr:MULTISPECIES: cation-translocating P-type ATPase [Clostridiaceae]MBC5788562.1 cation-translocating P-type ATPase [Clostridium facile]